MNTSMIILNSLFCFITCLRLIFHGHDNQPYRLQNACLMYLLIVATGLVVIRFIFNIHQTVSFSEVVINAVMCYAILKSRGNISKLFSGK